MFKTDGSALAPYGPFTSARSSSFTSIGSPSSSISSGSRDSNSTHQQMPDVDLIEMGVKERTALERSAARGDQLATYRLGRTGAATPFRTTLGP